MRGTLLNASHSHCALQSRRTILQAKTPTPLCRWWTWTRSGRWRGAASRPSCAQSPRSCCSATCRPTGSAGAARCPCMACSCLAWHVLHGAARRRLYRGGAHASQGQGPWQRLTSRGAQLTSGTQCVHGFLCREQILERKRREYRDLVPAHYDIEAAERSEDDACALRQAR